MLTAAQSVERKAQSGKLFILLFALCALRCSSLLAAEGPAAQHFQTGLAYERLGRLEEAYTALQLAFALAPEDARIDVALGIVACRLGRLDVAQRALERSITVESDSVASYYHLALVYEKNGVKARALDAWQRFIALNQDVNLKLLAQKHIQYLESGV